MKISPIATLAALSITGLSLAAPALAGDVALGEKDFKKCKACHSIVADDGTAIVKGGKVGPNLYGVIGRQIGSLPDFKYGASIVAAGADDRAAHQVERARLVGEWEQVVQLIGAYVGDRERSADDDAGRAAAIEVADLGVRP